MWAAHPCNRLVSEAPNESFVACFKWLISKASTEEFIQICASMWACWHCRNVAIFEGRSTDVAQLSISFTKLVQDYQHYSQKITMQGPSSFVQSNQVWRVPCEGWVKINFDAHISTPQNSSLGIAIRNHEGLLMLTGTRLVQASWSVEATEAAAALYGLELAHRLGYDRVHLEGDAMNVIHAILIQSDGLTPLHLIYENVYVVSSFFTGFMCSHVKRGGNTVAHLVARWDTAPNHEKVCMSPFTQSVQTLAKFDLI